MPMRAVDAVDLKPIRAWHYQRQIASHIQHWQNQQHDGDDQGCAGALTFHAHILRLRVVQVSIIVMLLSNTP